MQVDVTTWKFKDPVRACQICIQTFVYWFSINTYKHTYVCVFCYTRSGGSYNIFLSSTLLQPRCQNVENASKYNTSTYILFSSSARKKVLVNLLLSKVPHAYIRTVKECILLGVYILNTYMQYNENIDNNIHRSHSHPHQIKSYTYKVALV